MLVSLKGKGHDSIKKVGGTIEFKWGLKNARAMEKWHSGIKFIEEWNIYNYYKRRWGVFGRVAHLPSAGNCGGTENIPASVRRI